MGQHPKKRWGQNFLTDPNIARKIVSAALETPAPRLFIEIGPGRGALTEHLLAGEERYVGIEIDPQLAKYLRERFAQHPNLQLISGDVLHVDFAALARQAPGAAAVVVGNIPYNITSPILFKLFEQAEHLSSAVLMMQKEVGERLIAPPGTKAYGLLAIHTGLFCTVEKRFVVPAHLFTPRPKVDSMVVRLQFKKKATEPFPDFSLFRQVLRHCFQHRRKMLRKSLSMLFSPALLRKLKFDLSRRPEQLSIEAWKELTEAIYLQRHKEMKT